MDHEVEAIAKGARLRVASAKERIRIMTAVFRGIDRYDDLIAIMRSSESADDGRHRVAELMNLDRVQANAVTGITMNMLTQRHRRLMREDYDRSLATIADLEAVLASPSACASWPAPSAAPHSPATAPSKYPGAVPSRGAGP
ncbi:MAG: DNA gyrase subunit A [Streptosporangiaceae bacterium]